MQEVEELYAEALKNNHDSAMLHAFIAKYIRAYRENAHVEMMHIVAAEVCTALLLSATSGSRPDYRR